MVCNDKVLYDHASLLKACLTMSLQKLHFKYGNHVVQIRFTSLQSPIMVKCPIPTHFHTSQVTDKKLFPNTPETLSLSYNINSLLPNNLS